MNSLLLGSWLFVSMIYNGVVMAPPNPNLVITYEFRDDGTNLLHYHRKGEKGSCDRMALYEFSGQEIFQQVTWVAPHNADSCSQDPDMRLGTASKTHAELKNGKFYLNLRMGDDEVIYVWDKTSSTEVLR
jgi:hypothetical protein